MISFQLTSPEPFPGRVVSRLTHLFSSVWTRSEAILAALFVAVVLSFTVACSVVLGIAAAYLSVIALLRALPRNSSQSEPPEMVLVASENRAGGD